MKSQDPLQELIRESEELGLYGEDFVRYVRRRERLKTVATLAVCILMVLAFCLLAIRTVHGAGPALNKVNEARAARHLPPFVEDPKLTDAAMQAAHYRAYYLIKGHTRNDFKFLPPGANATAAGCAAWEPSGGWGACCTYDRYHYAGAGYEIGRDGRRYMHLFVR